MNKKIIGLLALLTFSSGGFAGESAGTYSVSPFLGWTYYDEVQHLWSGPVEGVRLGYDLVGHFGVEAMFSWAQILDSNVNYGIEPASAINYRLDFLYNFFPCGIVDPFLAAGPGGTRLYSNYRGVVNQEIFSARTYDDFTVNAGGGLKWYLSRRFVMRGEVRQLWLFNDKGSDNPVLHNWEYTVGLSLQFGGKNCRNGT